MPQPTSQPVTPSPTSCEGRKFYYTASGGCTNDDGITPDDGTFETREQCCIVHYPSPTEECLVKDICEPTKNPTPLPTENPTQRPTPVPTPEPTPLPTPSPTSCEGRQFYYADSSGCTNGDGMEPGAQTFETSEQCCIVKYPAGDCIVMDICEPSKDPTVSPSSDPTPKPTPLPTLEPTPEPTPAPTPLPTASPVTGNPTPLVRNELFPN